MSEPDIWEDVNDMYRGKMTPLDRLTKERVDFDWRFRKEVESRRDAPSMNKGLEAKIIYAFELLKIREGYASPYITQESAMEAAKFLSDAFSAEITKAVSELQKDRQ